jgi:hypothetical protein
MATSMHTPHAGRERRFLCVKSKWGFFGGNRVGSTAKRAVSPHTDVEDSDRLACDVHPGVEIKPIGLCLSRDLSGQFCSCW